ncbi:MAG TPA: Flp family type IVb pilin, partial [Pirellulales bacterium]|nr:Flp family type IVb pilin [Pirellulales bacterium]
MLWRWIKNEDGPTAVEYAIMLALIVLVCLTAVTKIGKNMNKSFKDVQKAVKV